MKTNYKEVLTKYIWDSTMQSGAQPQCWANIRKFITSEYGKESLLITVIDLLHHPHMSYHKRLFERTSEVFAGLKTFDLWELAEEANIAKDFHEEAKERKLFIPKTYFYDIKSFFLDLMLLRFFFKDIESVYAYKIDKESEFIILKRVGLTLMITKEKNMLLINLEKGDVTFLNGLHRGMHVPIEKLDQSQVLKKIESFGLKI